LFYLQNYNLGTSVISDQDFDEITQELLKRFDEVRKCNHPHKKMIEKHSLEANTGFHLMNKFPKIVQICGNEMLAEFKNVDNDADIYYDEIETEIKNINDLF